MKEAIKRHWKTVALPICLGLAAVAILVFAVAPYNSSASPRTEKPVVQMSEAPRSLNGNWHQVEGPDGVNMTADINAGAIQVNLKSRDGHFIYWLGTFETSHKDNESFTVLSLADDNRMVEQLSLDSTKVFSYKNGEITFPFAIDSIGLRSTIHLARGK